MTPREMQVAFLTEIGAHKGASSEAISLDLDSADIFYWLNRAQIEWTRSAFLGNEAGKTARRGNGFEENVAVTSYLQPLVEKDCEISSVYAGERAGYQAFEVDQAPFPCCDFMFFLSARARVQWNPAGLDWRLVNAISKENEIFQKRQVTGSYRPFTQLVRIAQHDDTYNMLSDSFNTTSYSSPLADISKNKLNIYTKDTFIIDTVLFNYIRKPRLIDLETNTSCELPASIHEEIVESATNLYVESQKKQNINRLEDN